MDKTFFQISLAFLCIYLTIFISIKWLQIISIKREFKNEKIKEFRTVKITSLSYNHEKGSKLSIGIYPIKSGLIFTQNELIFLPQRFSLFLALTEMPRKFNKNLDELIMVNNNSQELTFKFKNKEAFLKRKIIEISVNGNKDILGEINDYFTNWSKN